jgi:hypothetical protein
MGTKISQLENILMKILLLLSLAMNVFAFDQAHTKFNSILSSHVQVEGKQSFFKYKELKDNPAVLNEYLKELESLEKADYKKFTKDEQLAFWINVYNAYTIKLIVDNYPLDSIKDIGSIFSGPWDKDFIKLKLRKKKYTLNDVEHKTIRKYFKEPRIHFAVNCASMGCPSLLNEAFVASKLNEQLDRATKNFLSNTGKNVYNKNDKELVLSKIFKWYGGDFKPKFRSVEGFVSKYIKFPKGTDIEWDDYSWKLNEIKNQGDNKD